MNPIPQHSEPRRRPPAPDANRSPATPDLQLAPAPGAGTGWRRGLIAVAAAAVAAVGWQLVSHSATESHHANWPQIREASARPTGEARWQGTDGTVLFVTGVPVGDADRDAATTDAVRAALVAGDDARAEQIIAAAQAHAPAPPPLLPTAPTVAPAPVAVPAAPASAPAPTIAAPAPTPTLTAGMKAEIRRGDTQFFHLYLYDCCDEDGDVVDILLNGQLFQTLKLTNRGATISIPIAADGTTKVQLRGVHDGGGGITIGCRTSRGHGFLRAMGVGDLETLGTVRK